jgi:hypothetical protein
MDRSAVVVVVRCVVVEEGGRRLAGYEVECAETRMSRIEGDPWHRPSVTRTTLQASGGGNSESNEASECERIVDGRNERGMQLSTNVRARSASNWLLAAGVWEEAQGDPDLVAVEKAGSGAATRPVPLASHQNRLA